LPRNEHHHPAAHDGDPAAARPLHVQHRHTLAPIRRIDLDDKGREQAKGSSSASVRCGQGDRAVTAAALRTTVEPLAVALGLEPVIEERLSEVDYGQWTGRKIEIVQGAAVGGGSAEPSARVPDGEGLARVQARAIEAVREHDRGSPPNTRPTCCGCLHARRRDQAVLADALGTHLDSFQRITATPSMSVIRYTALRPFVMHVNHTGPALTAALLGKPSRAAMPVLMQARMPSSRFHRLIYPSAITTAAHAGILKGAMARSIPSSAHPTASWPDSRQPGNRTFFLQAVHDKRVYR